MCVGMITSSLLNTRYAQASLSLAVPCLTWCIDLIAEWQHFGVLWSIVPIGCKEIIWSER
jgi:hypothetical protein